MKREPRFTPIDLHTWKRGQIMPLSITCHHAAADGYHVHCFLERLQKEADKFEKYITV